ncbi:MAG: outer membrane beta-barrel protein [Gemmatimonadaceae bacterium]
MNRLSNALSVLLLSLVTVAPQAQEMSESSVTFGLGAGVSLPIGAFGDVAETGFHGQAMIGFLIPNIPVSMRGDLMYHSFSGKDVSAFGTTFKGPDSRIIAGAVNGTWNLSRSDDASGSGGSNVYLIGGVGLYNFKAEGGDDEDFDESSETKFGLNVGAGFLFNLVGLDTFAEARFHNVFTSDESVRMIPITIGVMFGGPR